MTIGLVVFSFAQRQCEPSPCNDRLADAVQDILESLRKDIGLRSHDIVIVAQWEVALGLQQRDIVATSVVSAVSGAYLDTAAVWAVASREFRKRNVELVVPVANQFLHLRHATRMITQDGFSVHQAPFGPIGFDPRSDQWWTRSRRQLLAYSALVALGVQDRFRPKPA